MADFSLTITCFLFLFIDFFSLLLTDLEGFHVIHTEYTDEVQVFFLFSSLLSMVCHAGRLQFGLKDYRRLRGLTDRTI
jgi:hypothetical protein